jgi:hypothetical protein
VRLALLTALLTLALATSAAAGPVRLTPSITGAGAVETLEGDQFSCPTENFDDHVTAPCLRQDFDRDAVTIVAVPRPTPEGHWEFSGWLGCDGFVAGTTCSMSSFPGDALSTTPTANFDDVKAPSVHTVTEIRPGPQGAVTFEFAADEDKDDGATFACWLDEQPPTDCTEGTIAYTNVGAGSHTFFVSGTDASDQTPDSPKATPFTIDAPPIPDSSGPAVVLPPPTFPPVPRVLGPNAVTAKVSAKRVFSLGKVRLGCPAVARPCTASASVKGRLRKGGKAVKLAGKSFTVRPSSTAAVKLTLGRKAARALAKRRRLAAKATLEIRAPDVTTRKDVAVTLRPAKRR